jgi:hypothetical protein
MPSLGPELARALCNVSALMNSSRWMLSAVVSILAGSSELCVKTLAVTSSPNVIHLAEAHRSLTSAASYRAATDAVDRR